MMRQQKWAHASLLAVQQWKGEADEAKLRTLCMKTPNLIHTAGLAQAVTFLAAREREVGKTYLAAVAQVLGGSGATADTLRNQVLGATDLGDYMALTRDISTVAVWLRRFAQVELKEDKSGES